MTLVIDSKVEVLNMHFGEGHNLFSRLFYSFGPIFPAIFMFICTIVLGEILYLSRIAKMRKEQGRITGVKYLILRYLFYLYLMMVYIQTGMSGAFWWIMVNPAIRWERIYLIPFTTSPDIVPYIFNVLMTVPLGFFLPLIWPHYRSLKKVAITAFLLSFAIEFTQLFSHRVSSTSDLVMNTTGAIIGFGIFYLTSIQFPKKGKLTGLPKLIKKEGAIYLALSFIGIVFLNHPAISSLLPQTGGHEGIVMVDDHLTFTPDNLEIPDWISAEEISEMTGDVLEVLNDRIVIRRFEIIDNEEGMVSITDANHLHDEAFPEDEIEEIRFTETTNIVIYSGNWQNPTIITGNLDDIEFASRLNVYGYYNEVDEFTAIEIKIMRVS